MKKIAFILVTLFLTGSMAIAQNPRTNMTPQERANKMTEKMVRDYSLTESQRQRLQDLNNETFMNWGDRYELPGEDFRTNRANMTEEQLRNHREEMMRERDAYNTRVRDILDDNQYRNYLDRQQEMIDKSTHKRRTLNLD